MAAEKTLEGYIEVRGLRPVSPKKLNDSLRLALESMSAILYGVTTQELTAPEQEVLRRGGLVLSEFHAETRRDVAGVDGVARNHDQQPLHGIAQLADVAAPRDLLERAHRRGREGSRLVVVFVAEAGREVDDQRLDVLAPLA